MEPTSLPCLFVFPAGLLLGFEFTTLNNNNNSNNYYYCYYYLFFLIFLGPHLWHREVPRLGGHIGATPARLYHSHSNAGSKPSLRTYATAHGNARSLTQWPRPRIEPKSSWIPVGLLTSEPQWELPLLSIKCYVPGTVLNSISWIISFNHYNNLNISPIDRWGNWGIESQELPRVTDSRLGIWTQATRLGNLCVRSRACTAWSIFTKRFWWGILQKGSAKGGHCLFAHFVDGTTETQQWVGHPRSLDPDSASLKRGWAWNWPWTWAVGKPAVWLWWKDPHQGLPCPGTHSRAGVAPSTLHPCSSEVAPRG